MQIDWIELRHKKSGLTLRKTVLDKVCSLSGENDALDFLFRGLLGASAFAAGHTEPYFLDVICRIGFHAAHHDYLWYAKNTADEHGATITDEEELYNSNNQMVMRRSFGELTIGDEETTQPIDTAFSMLHFCRTSLPDATIVADSFRHIHYYQLKTDELSQRLSEILTLPHGFAVLLDGRLLQAPVDLTPLMTKRSDLQLIAVNAVGGKNLTIIKKGNMISYKQ